MTQTCPDWRALVAHRNDSNPSNLSNAEEPAGWQEALEHLDGCPACRRDAPAADPTLLFRRLPALDMSEAAEAAEVESMRQAVAVMRTARRLEPTREWAAWKRWSAAAVLATAALSLGAGHGLPREATVAALGAIPAPSLGVALAPTAPTAPMPQVAPRFASERVPVVEELNRPAARVYQMDGGKNLSVVMIVDERLDV